MKYIKLYESWIQGKKHRFKDREEFEKQVLAFLSQSDRFELDYSNGDILNLDLRKYNEEDWEMKLLFMMRCIKIFTIGRNNFNHF
jgi:hypothetical protein